MNQTRTPWRLQGEEVGSCNCAWGCPCQFNALPTNGYCEAFVCYLINTGHCGEVSLDGARFASIYKWPGPVHEGNGTAQHCLDESLTPEQRRAILEIANAVHGGMPFEIFSAVTPNKLDPIVAPVHIEADREKRMAKLLIPGVGESHIEPIRNAVTGEEHRARIDLPNGFEYKIAEVGNSVAWKVTSPPEVAMEHENSYAQLNAFDWTNQ